MTCWQDSDRTGSFMAVAVLTGSDAGMVGLDQTWNHIRKKKRNKPSRKTRKSNQERSGRKMEETLGGAIQ